MHELTRIMFVADDLDVFPLIELSLSAVGGFEVHGFTDGAEAVANARRLDPQLIMLDVMMPGMDGPMTFAELRRIDGFSDTPIVFLTAKANSRDIERLFNLGASEVLTKPFDPMKLPGLLNQIWQRHLARAEETLKALSGDVRPN